MEKNLTTGSVGRQLIGFSLPYLLSFLLQTLYGMADLFIIGQYEGVAGTTAVAVGSQVMHMLTVMIVGLAMGTTVSIARAIGADDRPQAAAATGNTVTLFLSLSLVLTAGLLLLRRPITAVMSTPEAAVEGTVRYLTICFLGIPCITAYNILSTIFRGMGDSKSPMIFIFIACLANIALDYLFIGALHLGPAGAALSTSLSQAISVAISLAVIVCRRTMPLAKADLRPQKPVMDAILKIGVPISVQDGFIQISFIVITVIANRRGLTDAAAVGIVEKIIGFLFLVPSSMLSAVSALGAQNLGAGKPEAWLEDTRAELEVLDGLSPALQESLLRSTCCVILNPDSATGMDAVIDRWPDWWRMGDAEAFARAYLDGMAAEPDQDLAREYHAALVTERNMRMARQMAQWLEGENTCFVTLGLLHLVLSGDSVLSCLEEMGYTVERILPENV